MKNLMKAAFVMAMSAMVFTVSAQPRQGEGRQRDGQGQGQQREQMTPEQMVDRQVDQMVKEYQLNDKQKAEVKALIEKQQKDRQANRPKDGAKPTMEERTAQMEKMQSDFNAELKKILTPEQYKKHEDKQAARKKQMEERMKNRPAQGTGRSNNQ